MPKLRLGPILDDKPVRVTLDLPAKLHRDLVAYAEALARETGQQVEVSKLVAPMLERFLAGDRGFRAARSEAASNRHDTAGARGESRDAENMKSA
jgi:hypothetical protein